MSGALLLFALGFLNFPTGLPAQDNCEPMSSCWMAQMDLAADEYGTLNIGPWQECMSCTNNGSDYLVFDTSRYGLIGICDHQNVSVTTVFPCEKGTGIICPNYPCDAPIRRGLYFLKDLRCGVMPRRNSTGTQVCIDGSMEAVIIDNSTLTINEIN